MNESTPTPFEPAPQGTGVVEAAAASPKPRRLGGAGRLVACMLTAGFLGGGAGAGAATLHDGSTQTVLAQTAEFTPVIVNNPDSVNAITRGRDH